jgi:hypothetical protein
MMVLIATNSSFLRSLVYKSPVGEGQFVEINHKREQELHSGRSVCEYPIKSLVCFKFRKFSQTVLIV